MKNTWIWIVVVVIAAVGAFLLYQNMQQPSITDKAPVAEVIPAAPSTPDAPIVDVTATDASSSVAVTPTSTPAPVTITLSDKGFSPQKISVTKGTTVTFVNSSSEKMDIASAPHPTHNGYDGTNRTTHCATGYSGPKPLDQCTPSTTFSFTFDKAGSWPYHNHFNASQYGIVDVK